ncbi:hypothetical protein K504DRAFT_405223 [Pleomassaria siparia CBS 279.74]|uniref:DUF7924 domain-containing protein n=1 Tax=Pleomassaria siparia CBS 279.74 TaxID=1314801 RepID=A0A6G1KBH0_9PLEO|nr:hypothetical protein K504DRAFT_405223 [Pleomassaria siparia CBS 279.74]
MPPPKGNEVGKPKLSVEILRQHRISFVQAVHGDELLNDLNWLIPIRSQLTCMRREFPRVPKDHLEQDMAEFRDSGQDWEEACDDGWSLKPTEILTDRRLSRLRPRKEVERSKAKLGNFAKVANEARNTRERSEQEPAWTLFLRANFFKTFNKVHPNAKNYNDKLQPWELHEDIHWNEWGTWTNMNPKIRARTGPKPDLTYAFPIIDITEKKNSSYLNDSHVESFSLSVLSKLRAKKDIQLKSAPTTCLQKWEKAKHEPLDATDLMCFPWAIVEVKRNKKRADNKRIERENRTMEEFCYCQAANASAAALELREDLATKARDNRELSDSLIIFSITCVGPSVRLWVTYREKPVEDSDEKPFITMRCIWATSLELTWGVIALHMVMKNMREWIYSRVKPQLSIWIQKIREDPSPQDALSPGGNQFVRARRATSCEPLIQSQPSQRLEHLYLTPSKARPSLSRGETPPGSVDRQDFNGRIPRIQINHSPIPHVGRGRERERIDETDIENETDEGYMSNKSYGHQLEHNKKTPNKCPPKSRNGIRESELRDLIEREKEWGIRSSKEDFEEDQKRTTRSATRAKKAALSNSGSTYVKLSAKSDQSPSPQDRRRSSRF